VDNPASQITNPQPIHLSHPWVVFKQAGPPLSSRANSDAGGWSLTTPRELAARQNRHLASE
jgi:hypothetical protein